MLRAAALAIAAVGPGLLIAACNSQDADGGALVMYSGRSQAIVQPLVERFEAQSGIDVDVRYGGTSELAIALMQEGDRSRADLFWGQDAGALGALDSADLLAPLGEGVDAEFESAFRGTGDTWLPTSGRARVLAYSPSRVSEGELPSSVFELAEPAWQGRLGWAPTNASFQAFVTAMVAEHGEAKTRSWLEGVRENGAEAYANNSALLRAVAAGEVDAVLTNHYYLLRMKADDPDFPVEQTAFAAGDIGNLVNVAGIARVAASSRQEDAEAFIAAVLADDAQRFFAEEVFEHPVTTPAYEDEPRAGAADRVRDRRPDVNFEAMADLDASLSLLRDVELL